MAYPKYNSITLEKDKVEPKVTYLTLNHPGKKPSQRSRLQTDQDQLYGFPQAILDCNKVVMVKCHGWCIEAGLYIVKCSDIAIAADTAKFSQRGQRLAFGGLPTLPIELVMGHTKKITEAIITGPPTR